jgi:hypothetical protein
MNYTGSFEKHANGIPEKDRNSDTYGANVRAAQGLVNGGDRSLDAFKATDTLLGYRETIDRAIETNPPTKSAYDSAHSDLATCASARVYLDAEKAMYFPSATKETEAKEKA